MTRCSAADGEIPLAVLLYIGRCRKRRQRAGGGSTKIQRKLANIRPIFRIAKNCIFRVDLCLG